MKSTKKQLSSEQSTALLQTLQARFEKNKTRHKGVDWSKVQARLEEHPAKLWSLHQMEASGGEPDVTGYDKKSGAYTFCDCAAESPKGRRSICYDAEALESRKENKPKDSAVAMADEMGIELLNQEQYRELQTLGEFRSENIELDTNGYISPQAGRGLVLRPALRYCFPVPQWR